MQPRGVFFPLIILQIISHYLYKVLYFVQQYLVWITEHFGVTPGVLFLQHVVFRRSLEIVFSEIQILVMFSRDLSPKS